MKCKQHGWKYAVKRDNRTFCVLCRDLKKLEIEERMRVSEWLERHEELLAARSVSVFAIRISDLHVRTEDDDGQQRLEPSEAIKGDVEADFFDHLLSKIAPEADEGDSRVCIAGINEGSVRSAALKYGLTPSMVHRVRKDFETKGVKAATERLLNYARRKLQEPEAIGVEEDLLPKRLEAELAVETP